MRDYAELISDLRRHHCDAKEDDTQEVCEECAYDVIVSDKSKFNGITDVCTCGLMHRAADAIEELFAAVPHWISVEDALPEKHTFVLFYIPWSKSNMIGWIGEGGDLNLEGYGICYDFSLVKPTHWMPLPEAPKEDV